MMKKRLLRGLLFILLAVLASFSDPAHDASAEAEAAPSLQKSTIMIYMCGSNLESQFGSATADITEILSSGFDPAFTNVLIMTGGSKQWRIGALNNRSSIMEMGKQGPRPVWSSEEQLDMADRNTLSFFLRYCHEHYPADRFSLIIWDHGTGPNGGFCYDELFDYRMMTLDELRRALSDSPFGPQNRLSWIGFDACLMANVETAYTLRNYADFMIASQEAEPASGWNYGFLKDLEKDQRAEDTAKRIIDGYFEGEEDSKDVLTLSCIDLDKIWNVAREMDAFFEDLYTYLSNDTFSGLSKERHQMKSFGRSEYNENADSDLVDLISLTSLNDTRWKSGERLRNSIEEAVIFSRSNTEGAHGLSVYHPCFNRAQYPQWMESYDSMFSVLSRSYVLYLKRFGQILTGNPLVSWRNMMTEKTSEENGEVRFSMQLSDEQAEHLEHAKLLILQQIVGDGRLYPGFCRVWESNDVCMGEDNSLTASYSPKAVYIIDDETGEVLNGPIDCRITRDGTCQVCVLYMDENGILDEDLLNVMYYFDFSDKSNRLEISKIEVYDDVTSSYSARTGIDQSFIDQSLYTEAMFYFQNQLPTYKDGELLGYQDWNAGDSFVSQSVSKPCSWHLEVRENPVNAETLFALFELEDTQSVRHCSDMVRIFQDGVEEYEVTTDITGSPVSLELQPSAQYYRDRDMLCVSFRIACDNLYLRGWRADNILLNQERLINGQFSAWANEDLIISLPGKTLLGTGEIQELSFDLHAVGQDYQDPEHYSVQVHFPDSIIRNAGSSEMLASAVSDEGLVWTLREATRSELTDHVDLYFDVFNPADEQVEIELDAVALERYLAPEYVHLSIPSNRSVSLPLSISLIRADNYSYNWLQGPVYIEDMPGRLGIDCISSIRFFYTDINTSVRHQAAFGLPEPLPCHCSGAPAETDIVTLLQGSEITLNLETCVTFCDSDDGEGPYVTSLGIWLCNQADYDLTCSFSDAKLDGASIENSWAFQLLDYTVPAGTARFVFLHFERSIETEPEAVSFHLTTPTGTDEDIVFKPMSTHD